MKPMLVAALAAFSLSACGPVLDAYVVKGPASDPSTLATVWGDNDEMSFTMFTHIDGKHMPSRQLSGYPYSVSVSPGTHKLKFFIRELTGFPSGRTARFELSHAFQAGHTYVLRHRNKPGNSDFALVDFDDRGVGVACRYIDIGGMAQGYNKVDLVCDGDGPGQAAATQ